MKKYTITLPLPPSMNKVYTWNPFIHQKVYKKSGTSYLTENSDTVKKWVKKNKFPMRTNYFILKMWFWVPRRNADTHNYKKLLLDVLQHGELVLDDKFIADQTQLPILVDSDKPRCRMVIKVPEVGDKEYVEPDLELIASIKNRRQRAWQKKEAKKKSKKRKKKGK